MARQEEKTISVKILDKEYQVKCGADEVDALRKSAAYLDEQMRTMRKGSNVIGLERIAVMASLNIANDLLRQVDETEQVIQTNEEQLRRLSTKLDQAINRISANS